MNTTARIGYCDHHIMLEQVVKYIVSQIDILMKSKVTLAQSGFGKTVTVPDMCLTEK